MGEVEKKKKEMLHEELTNKRIEICSNGAQLFITGLKHIESEPPSFYNNVFAPQPR